MSWFTAKKQIDTLPSSWEKVASTYEINKPGEINNSNSGKYTRIQVNMKPIEGFDVNLVVYKSIDGSTKKAWYVLFNDIKNVVYKRDL